jgi:hypothetical protein
MTRKLDLLLHLQIGNHYKLRVKNQIKLFHCRGGQASANANELFCKMVLSDYQNWAWNAIRPSFFIRVMFSHCMFCLSKHLSAIFYGEFSARQTKSPATHVRKSSNETFKKYDCSAQILCPNNYYPALSLPYWHYEFYNCLIVY